jgi:hypothetical protein
MSKLTPTLRKSMWTKRSTWSLHTTRSRNVSKKRTKSTDRITWTLCRRIFTWLRRSRSCEKMSLSRPQSTRLSRMSSASLKWKPRKRLMTMRRASKSS